MSDQSLRERLARTLAGVLEGGWDAIPHDRKQQRVWKGPLGINTPSRDDFLLSADLLIPAFLEHLSANGLAIVPVMWTKEMADQATSNLEDAIEWTRDSYSTYIIEQPGHWAATAYDGAVKAAPPASVLLGVKEESNADT